MHLLRSFKQVSRKCLLALVTLSIGLVSPFTMATPKPEQQVEQRQSRSEDLVKISHKFFDKVFEDTHYQLGANSKIFVSEASANFSKYWIREHRSHVSKSYKSKTLARYSRILREQLNQAIEKSDHFTLATTASSADIVLQPSLERLNIFAPDDFIGKSFVRQAGSGTLDLHLVDLSSDKTVLHYVDNRETRYHSASHPSRANKATNTRDFKMLMKKWSTRVLEDLETRAARQSS